MTEIYCEHGMSASAMSSIIAARLTTSAREEQARVIVDFVHMFSAKYKHLVK